MLKRSNMHGYQEHVVEHIMSNERSGIFLDMGLGKSISSLTATSQLLYKEFAVGKVLVIAPKRVAQTVWHEEAAKWAHTKHLTFSLVLGTQKQRKEALLKKADIHVINRENVVWLVAHYGAAWPFDMVIIDELSSFKSPKAARFKALRQVMPKVSWVVGLTGTPAPNSLLDLWPQMYLLDQGQRLGKTITSYRDKYFNPGKRNGHIVFNYELKKDRDYKAEIYEKIGDICISMKARDYLELPERIEIEVPVILPPDVLDRYKAFEKELVLAISEEENINAVNAAALFGKLQQFANGAVYDANKEFHEVHDEKIAALEEILDTANGKPVLVFYTFKHDVARFMDKLKKYKPVKLEGPEHVKAWNRGEIQFCTAHPASAGHGLNMQAGGNIIVWFGPTPSLELDSQANARLDRQGQKESVIIHRLIAKGTVDTRILHGILKPKAAGQDALMHAVRAMIKEYKK